MTSRSHVSAEPFDDRGIRGARDVARCIVSVQAAPGIDLRATIEGLLATIDARDAEIKGLRSDLIKVLADAKTIGDEYERIRDFVRTYRPAFFVDGDGEALKVAQAYGYPTNREPLERCLWELGYDSALSAVQEEINSTGHKSARAVRSRTP